MKQPYRIYRDAIPELKRRRNSTIPFAQMKIGECTPAPMTALNAPNALALSAREWAARNRNDWRFFVRIVDGVVAIWRVK